MIQHTETFYFQKVPARIAGANKGTYGKMLLIAGSSGMAGAAYLAGLAAYRSGAGLVKIFTHEQNRMILQIQLPEAIVETYTEHMSEKQMTEQIACAVKWADVCVIGPGLGKSEQAEQILTGALKAICENPEKVLIADADALNLCANVTEAEREDQPGYWLKKAADLNAVAITPHPLEMSRFSGKKLTDILENPLSAALDIARTTGIITLLKGAESIVAYADAQQIFQNKNASPALAKAGSGDVLSGCIAGMYLVMRASEPGAETVQKRKQLLGDAVALGCLIHNLSGDAAAAKYGIHGVLAHETAEQIGKVLERYGKRQYGE